MNDISNCNYNAINIKAEIPAFFFKINKEIFKNTNPRVDLQTVKHMSIWLQTHIKGGPGLSEPSEKALKRMLAGEGGVCSDMTQIFNNFCVINDIPVREWGNTCAPFNRDFGGHSFNEIYCQELQKWVLVDVSWGMVFYDDARVPLSVIELYALQRAHKKVYHEFFMLNPKYDEKTIYKNYLKPDIIPFLICNYSNKTYDTILTLTRPYIPVFMSHFVIYIVHKSYHYRFPLDNYKKIFS